MKTPEEIKKGLRNAKHVQCMEIASDSEYGGTHYGVLVGYVLRDKIYIYITQLESDNESKQKRIDELESRLAQAERERDAAVAYIPHNCWTCKKEDQRDECVRPCEWQWRGPCPENTKEE